MDADSTEADPQDTDMLFSSLLFRELALQLSGDTDDENVAPQCTHHNATTKLKKTTCRKTSESKVKATQGESQSDPQHTPDQR